VFLATLGLSGEEEPGNRIYRIDTATDSAEEIYYESDRRYILRIAARDGTLYVCKVPRIETALPAAVAVLDLATLRPTRVVKMAQLTGDYPQLRFAQICRHQPVLVSCNSQGQYAVISVDGSLSEVRTLTPVPGTVGRLLDYSDREIVYLDDLRPNEYNGVLLRFYNPRERKEVKSINISQLADHS
jgi:hypothetical protein